MARPSVGTVGFKFREATPYLAEPAFGTVSYLIMMNQDKWNGLDKATQTAMLKAGHKLGQEKLGIFNKLLIDETEAMVRGDVKTTPIGNSKANAQRLFSEQAMEVAVEKSVDVTATSRDFSPPKICKKLFVVLFILGIAVITAFPASASLLPGAYS